MANRDDEQGYDDLLAAAQAAARIGDAPEMLRNLFTTPVADGLTRRLAARWPRIPRSVVDTAIAAAIDTLFVEVQGGGRVRSVVSFLYKVAHRRIDDFHRANEVAEVISPPDDLAGIIAETPPASSDDEVEAMRRTAISIARRLLPQLGQGKVIEVMSYVIDAVEAERYDLPNEEIGEALGITADAVRSLMSRGFQRLERLARAEGLPTSDLAALGGELDRADGTEEED